MDAYVFIRGADADDMSRLSETGDERLRFVTPLTGPYDGLVVIEGKGLRDVQNAVFDRIRRDAGLRDTDTSIAVRVPPPVDAAAGQDASMHVPTALRRWIVQRDVEAYARIRVERGHVVEVYEQVSELDGYLGHALVAGRCDLIVGMGGDTFQQVADDVLSQLHGLEGVGSTVTSFAINSDSAF
jgi:hypothetical protein